VVLEAHARPGGRVQTVRDGFAGGCCVLAEPGQLRWLLPAARCPDRRLHFAGEHTSPMVAWMDGALESGERAATEISTEISTAVGRADSHVCLARRGRL
jgi:monoamine oxidase